MVNSKMELSQKLCPSRLTIAQMRLGPQINNGLIVGENVKGLVQVKLQRAQCIDHSECLPFRDRITPLGCCQLATCIGHWMLSLFIFLQEDGANRQVTCIGVNLKGLRCVGQLQHWRIQ